MRDARGSTGPLTRRLHQILIVVEMSIAIVLLIGASLFARSLGALLHTDVGARPGGVLTMKINLAPTANAGPDERAQQTQQAALDRLARGDGSGRVQR